MSLFMFFEKSRYVAPVGSENLSVNQTGFESAVTLLPLPLECWGVYRHVSLCLVTSSLRNGETEAPVRPRGWFKVLPGSSDD